MGLACGVDPVFVLCKGLCKGLLEIQSSSGVEVEENGKDTSTQIGT